VFQILPYLPKYMFKKCFMHRTYIYIYICKRLTGLLNLYKTRNYVTSSMIFGRVQTLNYSLFIQTLLEKCTGCHWETQWTRQVGDPARDARKMNVVSCTRRTKNECYPDKTDVLYFRVLTVIVPKPHYKRVTAIGRKMIEISPGGKLYPR